ncbi:MAG: multidrug efflux SMR transporter [Phycisphaeraceae bacterium]|nr:multidrug efflux SMR transporter [Phycisphaeraceae bacterium]
MLPWVLLIIAGLFEVGWAIGLKHTAGFTRLWPSVWTIGAMVISFTLLAKAMQTLPIGISYTVWVGIGALGTVLVGAVFLGEKLSVLQVACMVLIGAGIIGLKLTHIAGGPPQPTPAPPPAEVAA